MKDNESMSLVNRIKTPLVASYDMHHTTQQQKDELVFNAVKEETTQQRPAIRPSHPSTQ